MSGLTPYQRATIGLWRRGRDRLAGHLDRPFAEAAAHALLSRLRRCGELGALLAAYEASPAADFALIASLLSGDDTSELFWSVRDAAFHERWLELDDVP